METIADIAPKQKTVNFKTLIAHSQGNVHEQPGGATTVGVIGLARQWSCEPNYLIARILAITSLRSSSVRTLM